MKVGTNTYDTHDRGTHTDTHMRKHIYAMLHGTAAVPSMPLLELDGEDSISSPASPPSSSLM